MNEKKDTKQRILDAALQEFAANGFGSTRMETIARAAEINKAMLFYYFSSKENLYQTVITDVLRQYFEYLRDFLKPTLSPEKFLDHLPEIVVSFFSERKEIIRIIGRELLMNPDRIIGIIKPYVEKEVFQGPKIIRNLIKVWAKTGLITEKEPVHFMMNIMSVCLGSFLARPMVEAILEAKPEDDQLFYEKRVKSITNVLKSGMLK